MEEIIDIEFSQDQDGTFDLAIASNGDFVTTSGFDTAILMSIFCERRADSNQVPVPRFRRGWIGNEDSDVEGFEIGSLIWLHEQGRLNSDTANGVESQAKEGVAWFLEDDLLTEIIVTGSFTRDGVFLDLVFRTENGPVETRNFELWQNTGT